MKIRALHVFIIQQSLRKKWRLELCMFAFRVYHSIRKVKACFKQAFWQRLYELIKASWSFTSSEENELFEENVGDMGDWGLQME